MGVMTECTASTPRPFVLFSWVVLVAGVFLLYFSVRMTYAEPSAELLLVILAAILTENFALRYGSYSVSLSFPMVVAAMTIAGPAGAGLAAAASSINLQDIRARRPLAYAVFNVGQVLFSACLGGWVYIALGGPIAQNGTVVDPGRLSVPRAILSIVAAGAVYSVANMVLTSVGARMARGIPFGEVLRTMMQYAPTQFALVLVGFLVAQVIEVSIFALPLFLFPLMLARQTYQRYAVMREAYVDTVRGLVGALEAKDPYTRGHSERVSGYAVATATQLAFEERVIDDLEKAALLHDIGKLCLPSSLLAKPESLSQEEFDSLRMHPERGAAMVARIPLLRGLADMVRCHHERVDGTGYPGSLGGAEIPQAARILAVADAYDAMTTNRAYRPAMCHEEAAQELLDGSGTQFDSGVVQAFLECRNREICGDSRFQNVELSVVGASSHV